MFLNLQHLYYTAFGTTVRANRPCGPQYCLNAPGIQSLIFCLSANFTRESSIYRSKQAVGLPLAVVAASSGFSLIEGLLPHPNVAMVIIDL